MANKKITDLTEATSLSNNDYLVIDNGTETKKAKAGLFGKSCTYVINTQSEITGTKDANENYTNVTAITGVTLADLKLGDEILIKELSVPDYWVSQITPSYSLNKLETKGGVTGVKGNSETDYRTGQVNITAANVGAQETLVSGTNIKTINSTSLLGSGNISMLTFEEE